MKQAAQISRPLPAGDPIASLLNDHEGGLACVHGLELAAASIQKAGFSHEEFTKICDSVRFIDHEVRDHESTEEQYLFPLLERHVSAPVEVMRREHREIRKLCKCLLACIREIEELKIYATTLKELVEYSRSMSMLLNAHMAKERNVLFPLAMQTLTKHEYSELTRQITGSHPV